MYKFKKIYRLVKKSRFQNKLSWDSAGFQAFKAKVFAKKVFFRSQWLMIIVHLDENTYFTATYFEATEIYDLKDHLYK